MKTLLVAALTLLPGAAVAAALCSPLNQVPATQGDAAMCCDGMVSDDGCGPPEDRSCHRASGKPVDNLNGFMWAESTDLDLPSPAGPVRFHRTYSSSWSQTGGGRTPGALGPGWEHSFGARLELG
jgi:hypothetical protein